MSSSPAQPGKIKLDTLIAMLEAMGLKRVPPDDPDPAGNPGPEFIAMQKPHGETIVLPSEDEIGLDFANEKIKQARDD